MGALSACIDGVSYPMSMVRASARSDIMVWKIWHDRDDFAVEFRIILAVFIETARALVTQGSDIVVSTS